MFMRLALALASHHASQSQAMSVQAQSLALWVLGHLETIRRHLANVPRPMNSLAFHPIRAVIRS